MMKKTILLTILSTLIYLNTFAQCFLDRHDTNWANAWISCEPSMNPNPARGASHWILYDFNYSYELFQMHVWNLNAPDYLMSGMQNLAIDISNDGVNWVSIGAFEIPVADGTSTYEGLDLYDFEGVNAQYVLITGLTNHGGACFGLSEIRIDVTEGGEISNTQDQVTSCLSANIFPNPINETSKAFISSDCSNAPIIYSIQDISGRIIKTGVLDLVVEEAVLDFNTLPIVAGSYVLSLQQSSVTRRYKIVKVER